MVKGNLTQTAEQVCFGAVLKSVVKPLEKKEQNSLLAKRLSIACGLHLSGPIPA